MEDKNLDIVFKKFNLSEPKRNKILIFINEILKYNEKINLTGIKNYSEFIDKNIYDSLLILNLDLIKENQTVLDVGSGGGFPGILLSIIFPETNFILVDSTAKKTIWLNLIKDTLNLKNVLVLNERIENLISYKNKIDILVARAVAPTFVLLELTTFLLNKNGKSIFYKGKNYKEELKMIDNNWYQKHNTKLFKIFDFKLLNGDERFFLVFEKLNTNYEYQKINYQKIIKKLNS